MVCLCATLAILLSLTLIQTSVAEERLSAWQFAVGDGQLSVKQYQFPGAVRSYWWISASELVVLSNAHLFLSRNYASTGEWESLTEGREGFSANNTRWPGMGIVTNILFPQVASENRTQSFILAETMLGTTLVISLDFEVEVVGQVTLETRPPNSPSNVDSAIFQSIVFHPTLDGVAYAILSDPSCREFHSFACKNFIYMNSPAVSSFPYITWRRVPISFDVMEVFFENPEVSNPSYFNPDNVFVLTKPSEALVDGEMLSFRHQDAEKGSLSFTTVLDGSLGEISMGKYIAVAAVDVLSRRIGLYITDDNLHSGLRKANFGTHIFPSDAHPYEEELDEQEAGYTVVDVDDEVFVNVYRGKGTSQQRWGHTYSSGVSGRRFTMSLPYNRRLSRGSSAVDFHRVAAIEGVILANVVLNPEEFDCRNCDSATTCDEICQFGSVLSRDNGKSWQSIAAPRSDTLCSGATAGCSLHLHSYSSAYSFNSHPVVSSRSAPGLIIATGNEGSFLDLRAGGDAEQNVYISRDAGDTWKQLVPGRHLYGEIDYGGVLFLMKTTSASRHLNFSLDEGATWMYAPIVPEDRSIIPSVILNPTAAPNAHYINMLAFNGDGSQNDVALWVDFSELKARTCVNIEDPSDPQSDFELFKPSGYFDEEGGVQCMMGAMVSYARKKEGSRCWVDVSAPGNDNFIPSFLLPKNLVPCNCSAADYECDVGFIASGENCIKDVNESATETIGLAIARESAITAGTCENGQVLRVPSGYRKLVGDVCVGGADLNPSFVPCPPSTERHVAGTLAIVALIGLGVLVLVFQKAKQSAAFAKNCPFFFATNTDVAYSSVQREEADTDEEAHESTALNATVQIAPVRRQVQPIEEGQELADNTVAKTAAPVQHETQTTLDERLPFSAVDSPSPPVAVSIFDPLAPPPLPTTVEVQAAPSPPKNAANNLDFLDFGQ